MVISYRDMHCHRCDAEVIRTTTQDGIRLDPPLDKNKWVTGYQLDTAGKAVFVSIYQHHVCDPVVIEKLRKEREDRTRTISDYITRNKLFVFSEAEIQLWAEDVPCTRCNAEVGHQCWDLSHSGKKNNSTKKIPHPPRRATGLAHQGYEEFYDKEIRAILYRSLSR